MELNKYDLAEWVAELISTSDSTICDHCMFKCENVCAECHNKNKLIKELIKKYNL
jgi:hypothetical protein